MWNRWDAEITLLQTESEIISAFDIPEEVGRVELLAERKSATRSEFYAADAVGRKIDEVFEVNALDYSNETCLLFDGAIYDIIRSYQSAHDRISLSCQRRGAR